MKFEDVQVGEVFYEPYTKEFFQRFDEKISVFYDFEVNEPFTQNGCTIEVMFEDDHEVEKTNNK